MNFNSTNSGKPDASANSSRPHPALVPIGQNSSSFRRPSRVSCHTWTSPTADWLWAVGGSASISPDSTGAIDDWQWMGAYWRRGHFIHRIFGDLALHRWDYRLNCHLRRLRLVPNVGVYSSTHERAACLTAVVWLHRASCIHRPRALPAFAPLRNMLRNGFFFVQGLAIGLLCAMREGSRSIQEPQIVLTRFITRSASDLLDP
jgi:hypothetical protein